MDEEKFQQWFNNGYLMAKYHPELCSSIVKNIEPTNDHLDGFVSGSKQYELELTKDHLPKKHLDKDHSKDFEDRDRD